MPHNVFEGCIEPAKHAACLKGLTLYLELHVHSEFLSDFIIKDVTVCSESLPTAIHGLYNLSMVIH